MMITVIFHTRISMAHWNIFHQPAPAIGWITYAAALPSLRHIITTLSSRYWCWQLVRYAALCHRHHHQGYRSFRYRQYWWINANTPSSIISHRYHHFHYIRLFRHAVTITPLPNIRRRLRFIEFFFFFFFFANNTTAYWGQPVTTLLGYHQVTIIVSSSIMVTGYLRLAWGFNTSTSSRLLVITFCSLSDCLYWIINYHISQ